MIIRNLRLISKLQLQNYKIDSKNYIDCLYYEIVCIEKGIIPFKSIEEKLAQSKYYQRKLDSYYQDRNNWLTTKEVAGFLQTSSRTIRRYYYKGYLRGERHTAKGKSRFKFCRQDIENFYNEK